MSEINTSQSKENLKVPTKQEYMPVFEEGAPVAEDKLRQYLKKLKQYFRSGNKTTESLQLNLDPVLLAPYIRHGNLEMDFPILYDHENHNVISLHRVLEDVCNEIFDTAEALPMVQNIPFIASFIQEKLVGEEPVLNYELQIKEAFAALRHKGASLGEADLFDKQSEQLENLLLSRKATLIGFSDLTAFQILNLQLENRNAWNQDFLNKLKHSISGLNEILGLHGEETDNSNSHFEFAEELVSFDKITEITPPEVSSNLSEDRLNSLRKCHKTLSRAFKSYSDNCATIFVTQKLATEFVLEKTLNEADIKITAKNSCFEAKKHFKKEIQNFVEIVFALRVAELEISQKYDEELHSAYFEDFDLSYLSDDDIRYFRTLIVVEESRKLSTQPKDFLALVSDGDFIKVLAINRLKELNISIGHTVEEEAQLELVALAIFRRNTCVYQGGADKATWLNQAFNNGLEAICPVLWNILIANPGPKEVNTDYLTLKTAIDSRYFPHLVYDIRSGDDFGAHFDISGNPQPEQSFPSFNLEIQSPSGKQTNQFSLTIADFLALDPENLSKLEIVPSHYKHEDLIALIDYLEAPLDSVIGKIPVFWTVDEQNILKQVAIPISWLRRCRASLDYWRFLQELGGVNSYHLKHNIQEAKSQWEADKLAEIEDLKTKLYSEFDRTRTSDLDKAIRNILNAFLDTDNELNTLLQQENTEPITPVADAEDVVDASPTIDQKEEKQKTTISKDAWVESDLCTSCSDCTDALPSVFKYDDDKLAYVHNPKGGTYAKIVSTAEKCPAECIHPGLPHNSSEKGLEKLIKRAEKFN